MNKHLFIGLVVCICALFISIKHINRLQNETRRMEGNISALMQSVEYYRTESGKSAARVERLELTKKELERNYQEVVQVADELKVKLKRLQAASTTGVRTEVRVETVVKDTVIYRDKEVLPAGKFDYMDAWARMEGVIQGEDIKIRLQVKDTLQQIIHRVPRKFLFIRWGTKAVVQEVVSSSPYTKITYSEYLEFVK